MVELFPIAFISTIAIAAILLLYFCYLEGAMQRYRIQDENPDIPEAEEVEMATIVPGLKF